MEEENNKWTFKLWLYLIPIFILAAWPAFKWLQKANSGDLSLSKDEFSAFNSESGEIRKTVAPKGANPDFDYGVLGVRYKAKDGEAADEDAGDREGTERPAAAPKRTAAAAPGGRSGAAAGAEDETKAKEQRLSGYTRGYLTYAMEKVINSPKTVGAILNNKNVISGFMSRDTVRDATASPEGLAKYLKSGGPANFINNPVVKTAMRNPAVISAVASSGLVGAMLETPAARALMKDPGALGDLAASNPELVAMIMANPDAMTTVLSNPDVSGLVRKFDTSAIKVK